MAEHSKVHGVEVVSIRAEDGKTRASFVPAWGGIGSSLELPFHGAAREVLYRHDFFWEPHSEKTRGGLPFLFPVCGRLEREGEEGAYLYDGRRYRLPIHGFSLRVPWTMIDDRQDDRLSLRLCDSDETRALYPFPFVLEVDWRVEPGRLLGEQRYFNPGDRPMPFYAGFHPFLATPLPGNGKEQTQITLHPERRLRYNARLTDIIGEAPPLSFPRSATDRELTESLHNVKQDQAARLDLPDGTGLVLRTRGDPALGGFSFVQCYTLTDRPFFCIEPWMGHPNGLNTVGGVCMLAPGATACTGFEMAVADGAGG